MGNQHGSHAKGGVVIEETLESMQKEKQRDEHLKNLEFKRSKSIRKSIAKRLKGGKKRKDQKSLDQPDAPTSCGGSEIGDSSSLKLTSDVISTQPAATNQRPSSPSVISAASSSSNTISKNTKPAKNVEKEEKKSSTQNNSSNSTKTKHKTERIYREDANRKPLVGEPQPFPSHVQVHNLIFDVILYNSSILVHMALCGETAKTCFQYNVENIGQLTNILYCYSQVFLLGLTRFLFLCHVFFICHFIVFFLQSVSFNITKNIRYYSYKN